MKSLDLYADPACPWSWLAVRWLTSVAPHRDVRLTFRSHSLWLHDGEAQSPGVPSFIRAVAVATSKESVRVLRIFEALRAADRESATLRDSDGAAPAIERLYLEWGSRVFVPGPPQAPGPAVLEEALAAAGLEESWLAAADDPKWDAAIKNSTTTLATLSGDTPAAPPPTGGASAVPPAGGRPVVPTLVDGERVLFRGAVVSAPLELADGLELWDALEILTSEPSFVGLSPTALPMPSFVPVSQAAHAMPASPVDNSRGELPDSVKLMG